VALAAATSRAFQPVEQIETLTALQPFEPVQAIEPLYTLELFRPSVRPGPVFGANGLAAFAHLRGPVGLVGFQCHASAGRLRERNLVIFDPIAVTSSLALVIA
jgi:hypothetical protein